VKGIDRIRLELITKPIWLAVMPFGDMPARAGGVYEAPRQEGCEVCHLSWTFRSEPQAAALSYDAMPATERGRHFGDKEIR
jgi:hypothetical protein